MKIFCIEIITDIRILKKKNVNHRFIRLFIALNKHAQLVQKNVTADIIL